jgi:hypothetical protein
VDGVVARAPRLTAMADADRGDHGSGRSPSTATVAPRRASHVDRSRARW